VDRLTQNGGYIRKGNSMQLQTSKIIKGTETSNFPFVCQIKTRGGVCTGALIHPSWVLTTAHCVRNLTDEAFLKDTRIEFATSNLSIKPILLAKLSDYSYTLQKQDIVMGSECDVMLIQLEKEINDIKPIKIFVQDPKWFVDRYITYVGFGLGEQVENAEEAQQFLGKKRFASAKVVKYEEPFLYVDKFSEQMIAQGDSGGPMLYIDAQGEYLIGLNVFGGSNIAASLTINYVIPFIVSVLKYCGQTLDFLVADGVDISQIMKNLSKEEDTHTNKKGVWIGLGAVVILGLGVYMLSKPRVKT
jgi:hypothetical protein